MSIIRPDTGNESRLSGWIPYRVFDQKCSSRFIKKKPPSGKCYRTVRLFNMKDKNIPKESVNLHFERIFVCELISG